MAQLRTATIAAALFCLFAVSLSRAPPQIDESADATVSLPISDADPALRLPSEPIIAEADVKSAAAEADSNPATIVTAVPMTELTFRPINRRFHVRSKRPCRHHFKFYHAMRENDPIPFGNDMILPSGENSDFEEPIARSRIPGRWMRLHHHNHHHLRHRRDEDTDSDSDNEEDEDRTKKVVLKRFNYDRFDREKKMKKLREQFRVQKEEEEKSKKSGFMKGVRKFLDRHF